MEELAEQYANWRDMGLEVKSLPAAGVDRVLSLSQEYMRPSSNDLIALALAESEGCPLLTDDAALRSAAK